MASGNALILLPILWITVLLGLLPLLISDRVRDLCKQYPTNNLLLNYTTYITGIVTTHVVLFLAVGVLIPAGSTLLITWAFGSTILVALLSWLTVTVVVPYTRDDVSLTTKTRLLLAGGAIWYSILVLSVYALITIVSFLLYEPIV